MSDSLQFALQQSVEDVLEKMFFIRSFAGETTESLPPEEELTARLFFHGEPSGSLTLRVPLGAARSISADFLAMEEAEISLQQVGEVFCELANMICGSVLSRVESAATFRLASPQWFSVERQQTEDVYTTQGQKAVHHAGIGVGSLTVLLQTEGTLCSTAEKREY